MNNIKKIKGRQSKSAKLHSRYDLSPVEVMSGAHNPSKYPLSNTAIRRGNRVSLNNIIPVLNGESVVITDPVLREYFLRIGVPGISLGKKPEKRLGNIATANRSFTVSIYDFLYALQNNHLQLDEAMDVSTFLGKVMGMDDDRKQMVYDKYMVYSYFKNMDLILVDGMQYGADWILYDDTMKNFQHTSTKSHGKYIVKYFDVSGESHSELPMISSGDLRDVNSLDPDLIVKLLKSSFMASEISKDFIAAIKYDDGIRLYNVQIPDEVDPYELGLASPEVVSQITVENVPFYNHLNTVFVPRWMK